jgi:hypothetical protein
MQAETFIQVFEDKYNKKFMPSNLSITNMTRNMQGK